MVIYSPLLFERQKVDEMAAAIKANRISMKKKIASIEKDIKDKEGYIKKKKESMRVLHPYELTSLSNLKLYY